VEAVPKFLRKSHQQVIDVLGLRIVENVCLTLGCAICQGKVKREKGKGKIGGRDETWPY